MHILYPYLYYLVGEHVQLTLLLVFKGVELSMSLPFYWGSRIEIVKGDAQGCRLS